MYDIDLSDHSSNDLLVRHLDWNSPLDWKDQLPDLILASDVVSPIF